jgi:5-(carboxyamino)imidazole ribonucleotide mutase
MNKPISIVMGSQSDLDAVKPAAEVLKEFGVGFDAQVLSAHRSPKELEKYVAQSSLRGTKIFIAAAGGAAALAGVIASQTTLPVIGVPMETKNFHGMDSLLSTIQMPSGVPVAAMAIGSAGAKNAALFALEILGLFDKRIAVKLAEYKEQMRQAIKKTKINL